MRDRKLKEYLAYAERTRIPDHNTSVSISDLYDGHALATRVDTGMTRYMNHGYWLDDTVSVHQSCENLMLRVVKAVQCRRPYGNPGSDRVLDVACGLGATTEFLSRTWPPSHVFGTNITDRQLAVCRRTAPGCHFERMDASELRFDVGFFQYLICIEAAFQFKTRKTFLREASQVLCPGGVLAMTDALLIPEAYETGHKFLAHYPVDNHCASLDEYSGLLEDAGFRDCQIEDITERGFRRHFCFQVSHLHEAWRNGSISFKGMMRQLDSLYLLESTIATQFLITATR